MVKVESVYIPSILLIITTFRKVKGWKIGLQETKEHQVQKKLEAFGCKFSKQEKLLKKITLLADVYILSLYQQISSVNI